jgi:hypothetical protein
LTRVLTDNVALCEALLLNAQTGTAKAEAGPTGLEAAPQPEEAPARGSPQSQATLAAIQINAGLNDAWVSQDAPKQGFFFTVYPDQGLFFLSWFTFDSTLPDGDVTAEFGAPDQRWVTGVGFYSGDSVSLNAELTTGGIFNGSDSEAAQQANYGTITITFISCNEATLAYNFPSLGLSGQMTLTRVLTDNVALCEELAAP